MILIRRHSSTCFTRTRSEYLFCFQSIENNRDQVEVLISLLGIPWHCPLSSSSQEVEERRPPDLLAPGCEVRGGLGLQFSWSWDCDWWCSQCLAVCGVAGRRPSQPHTELEREILSQPRRVSPSPPTPTLTPPPSSPGSRLIMTCWKVTCWDVYLEEARGQAGN